MKIFLCGLPKSGRTTVANAFVESHGFQYIDAVSWIRFSFRKINKGEHLHQYEDEYQHFFSKKMNANPWLVTDYVYEMMKVVDNKESIFVIDGITSPRDFATLFDYRQDVIVFLNRTDNNFEYREHENIGISVIRDYCFWLSAAGLLNKKRWLEFNFKIPGEDSDHIKVMGAQNSVFIVKSINKVIYHLSEKIKEIIDALP